MYTDLNFYVCLITNIDIVNLKYPIVLPILIDYY